MPRRRTVLRAAGTAAVVTLAGCQDGGGESEELAVEHVRFVESQPTGYREYTEVPEATYDREEAVWIYFEPVGVASESTDAGQFIDLTTSLTVTSPTGEETTLDDTIRRTVDDEDALSSLFLYWQFDPSDPVLPGEYEAAVSVTDVLADGASATATEPFVVGEGDVADPYVAALRMDLSSNLDVTVRRVERAAGALELEYDSDHPIDSRPSGEEVGYVVGRYTAYVAEGLDTEELVATVHASDGDYRYWLSSERARAWSEGEVTTDEVVSGIYENMEEL